jgi:cholesterol transport system auxiliary component
MKTACFRLALLSASVLLGGCVSLGNSSDTPAAVYYVLNDAAPTAAPLPPAADTAPSLRVMDTTVGSFYDTDQLVFSRGADTRGHYQFARWTESPGKRFTELMRSRLERQGGWNVSSDSYVRADWLLDTELVELYHDAASEPGQARLVIRASLIDIKQRKLLGQRVFQLQAPLASYDAAGAAQASSQAVGRALDDLTAWLASFK